MCAVTSPERAGRAAEIRSEGGRAMSTHSPPKGSAPGGKNGYVPIFDIRPSPENEQLYRPVDPNDPDILALAESIERDGILEPLVATRDGFIISGHRRYAGAKIAGLRKVPCRKINITRDSPEFLKLLREHNRQRIKSRDEILREEIASIDPEDAHCALSEYRRKKSRIAVETIEVRTWKGRAAISPAKEEFLCAVERILTRMSDYLPLNNRQIFYQLINDPPLIHSSKPNSRFRNDLRSYKALCDLLPARVTKGEFLMTGSTMPLAQSPFGRCTRTLLLIIGRSSKTFSTVTGAT
jgi:hypothetical protein